MLPPHCLRSLALLCALAGANRTNAGEYPFHHENVMGTTLELRVRADSEEGARWAEERILGEIDRLSAIFSTYDRASELSRWQEETTPTRVSPELLELLQAADDWRSRSPDFTGEGLERNLALAEAMRPVAERHDVSVAAVAVAWTLAWRGVTGAIVGARSPRQVDGWVAAATLELTDADLDEIAQAVRATGAGSGPERPAS